MNLGMIFGGIAMATLFKYKNFMTSLSQSYFESLTDTQLANYSEFKDWHVRQMRAPDVLYNYPNMKIE